MIIPDLSLISALPLSELSAILFPLPGKLSRLTFTLSSLILEEDISANLQSKDYRVSEKSEELS